MPFKLGASGGGGAAAPLVVIAEANENNSAHRYWRLYITNNNGSQYTSIVELEMRATAGGADQCSGGTPLFSTEYSGQSAANAFDNSTGTNWASGGGASPHYLGYDFGTPVFVREIAVTAIVSGLATQNIKDFSVQYSDDNSNWLTAIDYTNQINWGNNEVRLFSVAITAISGSFTTNSPATDWMISVLQYSDGANIGNAFVTDPSFSLNVSTEDPVIVVVSQRIDYAWEADIIAGAGDIVIPSDPAAVPHLFEVTVGGDFGASEPVSYNLSGTTTAGAATLTYVGPLINPMAIGPINL